MHSVRATYARNARRFGRIGRGHLRTFGHEPVKVASIAADGCASMVASHSLALPGTAKDAQSVTKLGWISN